MFSKVRNITLAVAAVAAVGAAVLVSSAGTADARGFGGGGFGGRGAGGGMHVGIRGGGNFQARVPGRVTGFRPGIRVPGRPGIQIGHRWPHYHPNWCRITHRCGIHVRWYRPWVYGGVAATTPGVGCRSRRGRRRVFRYRDGFLSMLVVEGRGPPGSLWLRRVALWNTSDRL